MKLIHVSFIFLCFSLSWRQCLANDDVCDKKCPQNTTLDCSRPKDVLHGRCCVNSQTNATIGVDLINCNISKAGNMFVDMKDLKELFLQGNPLKKIEKDNLANVTGLEKLTLPSSVKCPGGFDAWGQISIENETIKMCMFETDTCKENKVTCPNGNSECINTGPGMISCACKSGYHGYKCLRQGTFPTEIYAISLSCGTVAVCVILWLTQRRHVKKQQ